MDEITYILGAGASYQSMPLVKNFNNRFKEFLKDFRDNYNYFSSKGIYKAEMLRNYKRMLDLVENFSSQILSHQSFDTYFKKLFHINTNSKIRDAKLVLNLYFLWEHLYDENNIQNDNFSLDNDFKKKSQIDKRYDALIAGLLEPIRGEKKFIKKINFITWNYDLNLFLSIKNFLSPDLKIGEYYHDLDGDLGIWKFQKDLNVVNINGSFYSSLLKDFIQIKNELNTQNLFEKLIEKNWFLEIDFYQDSEIIKFSWENDVIENSLINECSKFIENSKDIIIIGYSFPLYNRFVDRCYLNKKLLNGKNIFIQDKFPNEINETFCKAFNLNTYKIDKSTEYVNIEIINNCDYFYIPNSIFN